MTREYIRSIKSRYTREQHVNIIVAYLFNHIPIEKITHDFNAGEMDIHIILSSYRLFLSNDDKLENAFILRYIVERSDWNVILSGYVEKYRGSDLADVSPTEYFKDFKRQTEEAEFQRTTLSQRKKELTSKTKKKTSIAPIIVRICAVAAFLSLVILLPIYFLNNSTIVGDKNTDLTLYSYENEIGFYGGQGKTEPSGLGRIFATGYDYVGQFSKGKIKGIGSIIRDDRITYIGEASGGNKTGFGIETVGGDVYIGFRKNNSLNGLCLKVSGDIFELSEYVGDVFSKYAVIGNYKQTNFSVKNSNYTVTIEDGRYKIGKTADLENKNGSIIEWNNNTETGLSTISFCQYQDGVLQKAIHYECDGDGLTSITYNQTGFTVMAMNGNLLCVESGSISNPQGNGIQYRFADGEKSMLFGKYEKGTVIKLGKLLKTGDIVYD